MFGNTTTRTYITGRDEAYRCSRARRRRDCTASRIPRHTLEDAVIGTLKKYILLPDSLAAAMEIERHATDHRETKRTERLAVLNAEKKKLASKIANITHAIADRGHSQTLLDTLTQLESQRAVVLTEITELSNMRFEIPSPLTEDEVKLASDMIIDILQNAAPERVRQILHGFLRKVTAKKVAGHISGSLTYILPPLADLLRPPDPPPFDSAPTDDITLPISSRPVGAQKRTSQTAGSFFHPLWGWVGRIYTVGQAGGIDKLLPRVNFDAVHGRVVDFHPT
jgi:hypothetical protein